MEKPMQREEENYRVNWSEAFDYMHSVDDPVVRNLLGMVYETIVRRDAQGVRPEAPFDLLYCFQTLHDAFIQRAELHLALEGNDSKKQPPPDWI